jgi:hypothetical protein
MELLMIVLGGSVKDIELARIADARLATTTAIANDVMLVLLVMLLVVWSVKRLPR